MLKTILVGLLCYIIGFIIGGLGEIIDNTYGHSEDYDGLDD